MGETVQHPESWYQTRILKAIKAAFPDCFVWKAAAGPYSRSGIPDICLIVRGHFFGLEVKRPGGKATALQEQTIMAINAAGGTAAVVTGPEMALDTVRSFFTENDQ